jgi:hypothetical protein
MNVRIDQALCFPPVHSSSILHHSFHRLNVILELIQGQCDGKGLRTLFASMTGQTEVASLVAHNEMIFLAVAKVMAGDTGDLIVGKSDPALQHLCSGSIG